MPFISDLVNLKVDPANVSSSIRNAVICQNGGLANQFRYISGPDALFSFAQISEFETGSRYIKTGSG